jgi:hypothetical protein
MPQNEIAAEKKAKINELVDAAAGLNPEEANLAIEQAAAMLQDLKDEGHNPDELLFAVNGEDAVEEDYAPGYPGEDGPAIYVGDDMPKPDWQNVAVGGAAPDILVQEPANNIVVNANGNAFPKPKIAKLKPQVAVHGPPAPPPQVANDCQGHGHYVGGVGGNADGNADEMYYLGAPVGAVAKSSMGVSVLRGMMVFYVNTGGLGTGESIDLIDKVKEKYKATEQALRNNNIEVMWMPTRNGQTGADYFSFR